MKNKLYNILFEKVDSKGLGVFRVFYSIVLFFEVLQLFSYRKIIYDDIPFVDAGEITISYLFLFWFIIIFFLLIGFFTRYVAIINYMFSVIIFSSAAAFEYHVFYAYVGINFLLIIIPIGNSLSIDDLFLKLKHSNIGYQYKPDKKVYMANYLIPVFIGIGLVYFDSILFKYTSPMWLKGLGMWLPANLPMATWTDSSWLMNNEFLVKFLCYLVIIFETIFIFLFWFKPFRIPFLLIGLFFHFGILIEFPIPWFALCAIALYILMIPTSFWYRIAKFLQLKKPIYVFLYDSECPLCAKSVVFIKHMDVFRAISCKTVQNEAGHITEIQSIDREELLINIHGVQKNGKVNVGYYAWSQLFKSMIYTYPLGLIMVLPGFSYFGTYIYSKIAGNRLTERCTEENCPIPEFSEPLGANEDILIKGLSRNSISRKLWKYLILFVIISQFSISWFSPLIQNTLKDMNMQNSILNKSMQKFNNITKRPLIKFLGITKHPVFMDSHFNSYNHIIKVEMVEKGKLKNIGLLKETGMPGEIPRGAFWVHYTFRTSSPNLDQIKLETGLAKYISLYRENKNAHFKISVKEIDIPTKWEKDFLKKQMAHPWKQGGIYTFKTGFNWNNYMINVFDQEKQSK